jgi:hypothetical protein
MSSEEEQTTLDRAIRWGIVLAVLALAVFVFLGYYFGWKWTGFPQKRPFDWIQILVIPAAVVIGAFLLDQTARKRERDADQKARKREKDADQKARKREKDAENRAQEQSLQREFHKDLVQAYNAAKKSRRLLKVKKRRDEVSQEASPYDGPMEELVSAQLQFELLEEVARTLFFSGDGHDDIPSKLDKAEKYLGNVVNEYEKGVEFDRLEEFIAKRGDGPGFLKFQEDFSDPVHAVAREVLEFLTEKTE